MLTIYRRHIKRCPHRREGRKYRRCRCPIWVDGTLAGTEVRKSLGLRNWEKAQVIIREWEVDGRSVPRQGSDYVTVADACDDFVREAEARELCESTVRKYQQFVKQVKAFAKREGRVYLRDWDLEILRRFRSSWKDGPISALKKLERLRSFFRFAHEAGWIVDNHAPKLKPPTVKPSPTMPFTRQEVIDILAACDRYRDSHGRTGNPTQSSYAGWYFFCATRDCE